MIAEFNITSFFGRLHPALVHLPIGILLLAFCFHLLSFSDRYKKLKSAVRPALFYGMLSAFASVLTGYILSKEGGYDERLLVQHKWMGFATAGLSCLVYLFTLKVPPFSKEDRRKAVFILFFPLVILVLLTGHWGGSLTRGEDYIFESAKPGGSDSNEIMAKRIRISDVDEAEVFNDIIRPLLEEKCFACHSSKKQKGQLRLDAIDLILKGGKHGEIVVPGNAEESEMYKRLVLSTEIKEHMPPRKEPQLTSVEVELIRWWINQGASFEKKAKEFTQRDELMEYLHTRNNQVPLQSWVPEKEVEVPDQSVIKELRALGIAVVPVAANSNYLSVSFAGKKAIVPRDIELVKSLSQQLIDLNLSWSSISDQELIMITSLKELRVLNLSHTAVTNVGVLELKKLENLALLNLVETKVDNGAVKSLNEMKSLKELYIFNTKITKEGLTVLNTKIKIDTGKYELPPLASDTVVFRKK